MYANNINNIQQGHKPGLAQELEGCKNELYKLVSSLSCICTVLGTPITGAANSPKDSPPPSISATLADISQTIRTAAGLSESINSHLGKCSE